MAGGGEVIANGSIHYNIVHDNGSKGPYRTYSLQGVDPTPVADVRKGKDHPGDFQVTLRFNSASDAQTALAAALRYLKKGAKGAGGVEVVIFVPANKKTRAEASRPYPNPHAQVVVDW
jgi:hypothetical protein